MWSDSRGTGRSAGSLSSPPPHAAIPSRSASGRSSATNSRARGLFSLSLVIAEHAKGRRRARQRPDVPKACRVGLEGRLGAAEQDAEQVHADQGRAFADVGTAAGDDVLAGDRGAVGKASVEADKADRLLLAAAIGARDAGDRDGNIGLEALQGSKGHRLRNLSRDGALGLDQLRIDSKQLRLGLIRV